MGAAVTIKNCSHLGKARYSISKVLRPFVSLILILISLSIWGCLKSRSRSCFLDAFISKLLVKSTRCPQNSTCFFTVLIMTLCRGRIGSTIDSGQQHDLAMILLQPGQITGKLGWCWERIKQPISPETVLHYNSFLLSSSLAEAKPCQSSIASYPRWADSGQGAAGLDLRGESSVKVRERVSAFNVRTWKKVAWSPANVAGTWTPPGPLQACAFWMPLCSLKIYCCWVGRMDFWIYSS